MSQGESEGVEAWTEIGTIINIFKTLGTPGPLSYPGGLAHWSAALPRWARPKVPFRGLCHRLEEPGLTLLLKLFDYNPAQRISASAALEDPYFATSSS